MKTIIYLFAGDDELSDDEEDTVDSALFTTTDFDNTERGSLYVDSTSSDCLCAMVLIIWGFGGLNQS